MTESRRMDKMTGKLLIQKGTVWFAVLYRLDNYCSMARTSRCCPTIKAQGKENRMPLDDRKVLEYRPGKTGQLECKIDLEKLFKTQNEHDKFNQKWSLFLKSDKDNRKIYNLKGNILKYQTEELIPTKTDKRPPLLLLLGNPASHSVISGMFFAFEGKRIEHRFWKILRRAGILNLPVDESKTIDEKNVEKRNRILDLDYDSPFRVGLSVFISMPSVATDQWSGVAGIGKLIGSKALSRIEKEESDRVLAKIHTFIPNEGIVVTFQKNCWDSLKSDTDIEYSSRIVNKKGIRGKVRGFPKVTFMCAPPTRLSGSSCRVLQQLLKRYLLHNAYKPSRLQKKYRPYGFA